MRVVIPGLLIGLGLVFISTTLTVGEQWDDTCLECGLVRHHKIMFGMERIRDESTARTIWHDRRMGAHADHRWAPSSLLVGLNVWQTGTGYSSSYRYESALYYSNLPRVLNRLEPLNLDREFHRDLVHDDAERRGRAVTAAICFDFRWNDEAVRDWSRKTRIYLQDPSLRHFPRFDPPPPQPPPASRP
jgi:hypothetical protein